MPNKLPTPLGDVRLTLGTKRLALGELDAVFSADYHDR